MGDFERLRARVDETFQWLLVPYQTEPTNKVEWQEIRLSSGDGIADKAFKRLKRDGLIYEQLAGSVLRLHLDKILWKETEHIDPKAPRILRTIHLSPSHRHGEWHPRCH